MTDSLRNYIDKNFSLTVSHLWTLEALWDYMEEQCHTLETADTEGYRLVPLFWHDFMMICDAGGIDITEKELIDCVPGAVKEG